MKDTKKAKCGNDASNGIKTRSAAEEEQTSCLAADIQQRSETQSAEAASEDQLMQEYAQQVEDMKRIVEQDLAAKKYSFELAKIGYDIYTDIEVYDYDIMLDILQGNGYCCDCANAFIDSFSLTSELSTGSDKLVIRRKEKEETELMFRELMERQAREQKKQATKRSKKERK